MLFRSLHLDYWYSQSHPLEDFAETFAVWLKPGARWRARYQGWPALRKLEYVDRLMKEIADTPPKLKTRRKEEPVNRVRMTPRRSYAPKKDRKGGGGGRGGVEWGGAGWLSGWGGFVWGGGWGVGGLCVWGGAG